MEKSEILFFPDKLKAKWNSHVLQAGIVNNLKYSLRNMKGKTYKPQSQ